MTEIEANKNTYWNGKGPYEKEYEEMYEKLVPLDGEADTVIGELLRKSSRSYYRFHNDGDIKSFGFFKAARPYKEKLKQKCVIQGIMIYGNNFLKKLNRSPPFIIRLDTQL